MRSSTRACRRHAVGVVALVILAAGFAAGQGAAAGPPAAKPPEPGYEAIVEKLSAYIAAENAAKDLPATSISLVVDDRTVWSAGFGKLRAAGDAPAGSDTIYRVGSVSKLFTDLAVMKLVEQGKIDLDAPVATYIPNFAPRNPFAEAPTVRQLMNHQSGLIRESPVGNYFDPDEPTTAATVESLNGTQLVSAPGTITKYSNAAVATAGLLVERLVGEPFETHVQKTLLAPMEMTSSDFRRSQVDATRIPDAWMWAAHLPRFAAPTFDLGTLPAGNLYSTVDDLGNLLITVFNDGEFRGQRIISQETLATMLTPRGAAQDEKPLYGVGFRLNTLDGRRTFGHNGAVYGYSTNLLGMPEEKLGVAAVVALDGGGGFTTRLSEYAMRLLVAQREGKPLPDVETTAPLAAGTARKLAGTYANGDRQLELVADNDRLLLRHNYLTSNVRALGDGLIVDDPHTYGPKIVAADDGQSVVVDGATWTRQPADCPPPCPEEWRPLIGEYGWDHNVLYIYEHGGQLWALIEWFYNYPLTQVSENVFAFPNAGLYPREQIVFQRDADGRVTAAVAADVTFPRRDVAGISSGVFRITPRRPVEELRAAALVEAPPREVRPFRPADLVEPSKLDETIKLEIRYASTDNFLGTKIYESARAFLQRPAAEALVRVNQGLKERGYGLLIHDAYRPWYVTKMFWDGTTESLHGFVANPAEGSKHNRGCAVDLTLYELESGQAVEMPGVYDEMSSRSFPLYPGGEHEQRWRRELLRAAMEREGFTVNEAEWWHFDYRDWRSYAIGNARFEDLGGAP